MTLGCGDVPKEKAKKAAARTAETGNEHGFYFCGNGESGPIKEGSEKKIKIDGDCGDSKYGIFHTHPNDIAHLSEKDREALDIDGIGAVCAGDTDENMKCEIENEDMSCVRDFSDGAAAGSPESDVLEAIESAGGVVFGEPGELERLPKNSKCQEWKDVASKSDYHDSDTVKRCDHYDTGGDSNGGGGSTLKDKFHDLEKGDKVVFNDRKQPLEVFKIMESPASLNGGPRSPDKSVLLKGSRGGKYHLFILEEDTKFGPESGELAVSRSKSSGRGVATPEKVTRLDTVESGGGGGDDGGEDRDIPELGDGPVSLETSEWYQYVIPAVRELAGAASDNDNARTAIRLKEAADTIDDQAGETRSLEDQTGGDWGYVVEALNVIAENASDDSDADKLRELAESIESQAKGDGDDGGSGDEIHEVEISIIPSGSTFSKGDAKISLEPKINGNSDVAIAIRKTVRDKFSESELERYRDERDEPVGVAKVKGGRIEEERISQSADITDEYLRDPDELITIEWNVSDDGGNDGTPPYKDDEGNFTDERMKNAFYWTAQIRGWMIEGPHAGIRGTYCVEIQAGQPIIVLDKDEWNESSVNALVDSYHDHNFPRVPPKNVKELDDEWRIFVEPTDERLKWNNADEWRDIDPACTDEHPDEQTEDTDSNGGDGEDDGGDEDVGEWTVIETGESPHGDELTRWKAEYPHPLSEHDTQYLTLHKEENRGDVYGAVYHFLGEVDYDSVESRVVTEPDVDEARSEAIDWMEENQPETVDYELPKSKNGWERTRFGTSGFEHWDAAVSWERWIKPSPRTPDVRKQEVLIFKKSGKFHVRNNHLDGDGDSIDSKARGLPTLPKNRSLGGRSKGRKKSFRDFGQALDPVMEYIENHAQEKTEWPDVPRFDITTKNDSMKPVSELIKRTVGKDPNVSKLTGVKVTNSTIEFRGTDGDNVGMFDIDMSAAGFENVRYNKDAWDNSRNETGKAAFDGYTFADYFTNQKKSDTVTFRTQEPRNTNDPVEIVIGNGDVMIPLWPEYDRTTPDLPEIDYEASFTVPEARDLADAAKDADSDGDQIGVSATENRVAVAWGDDNDDREILPTEKREGNAEAVYSTDKLRNCTMSIPRPASKSVDVELTDDHPIQLFYRVGGTHRITYLVAPRIQTDEVDIDMEESCPFELEQHEPAPEFEGKNQNGETVSPEWDGQNVVYTYPNDQGCRCSVTAAEIDEVAAKEGFDAYGISTDGVESKREFAEKLDLSHELISDPDGEIVEKFGLSLDENGNAPRALFKIEDGEIADSTTGERPTLEQPDLYPEVEETDSKMLEHFEHPSVAVITGKRGSGKSSLSYKIAEDLYRAKGVTPVTIGLPEHMQRKFPEHWEHEQDPREAPPDSTLVIDEAYQKYHSRRSGQEESVSMSQLINLSRHCQRSILFVSQNSSYLEKSAASEADYLLMKEPGNFHSDFERRQFKQLVKTAENAYDNLPENMDNEMYTYVYGDEADELIRTYEAPWYDDDLSKGYSAMCSEAYSDQAVEDAELSAESSCPFSDD